MVEEKQEKINNEDKQKKRPYYKNTKKTQSEKVSESSKKQVKDNEKREAKVVKEKDSQKVVEKEKTTRRNTKSKNNKFEFKKSNLKIIPLGGLEEIGNNMTIFEYEDEIVVVDCGLEFPTDDMLGVDLVIPDVTYLERNKEKVKGLVITHGHEDHIGAIPYILKQINVPIYGTKLTLGLIKNKLEEHKLLRSTKLHEVEAGQTINFGKMKVEFIRSCHSIPDAVMLAIYTPVGKLCIQVILK